MPNEITQAKARKLLTISLCALAFNLAGIVLMHYPVDNVNRWLWEHNMFNNWPNAVAGVVMVPSTIIMGIAAWKACRALDN